VEKCKCVVSVIQSCPLDKPHTIYNVYNGVA
jgi:hypothetical protein